MTSCTVSRFLRLASLALPLLLATRTVADDRRPARPPVDDPTKASARLKAALSTGGPAVPDMVVKGLVMKDADNGAIMFELPGGSHVLARPGVAFTATAEGEVHKLVVKRITSEGIEVEAPVQKETAIIPSFGPAVSDKPAASGGAAYVEFHDLPLLNALQMLSDQSGNNYSASLEANKIAVNVMLRNVPANSVVEEICKSHNLWFKRDEATGIMRIMTVTEFEKDLVGFREEQTEVFTLKYPNVPEIATAIGDLFGDRVQLSLGTDANDEESRRDLEGRFDRFDVLTQRTEMSSGGSVVGGNVNGFVSNGGSSSYFGGYNNSRNSTYSSSGSNRNTNLNSRFNSRRSTSSATSLADDEQFRSLTPEQAQRVDQAILGPGHDNDEVAKVEALRKRPATIFVTASRRNNMVVVRTADSRAMADIRALVIRMDVQTPLVLLEVQVVQIDLGRDFRSAFDYQFGDGHVGASFSRNNVAPPLNAGSIDTGTINTNDMTFTIVSDNFRAQMQLFEQKNRVKTLATPTLLTANNEVSRLFLGEERPLVRNVTSQTIITDNNVATTPNTTTEFRNVGDTLLITPNINSDRTVTLRLVQEKSFISPNSGNIPVVTGASVQNVKVDVVATRSVSGTFVAQDGMAIAVGGMIEDTDSDKRGQVPVLGSIPVLGTLFRRQEKSKSRSELVIVIRPHVMSTPVDSERLTTGLLQRLAPQSLDRLHQEGFFPPSPPAPAVSKNPRPVLKKIPVMDP